MSLLKVGNLCRQSLLERNALHCLLTIADFVQSKTKPSDSLGPLVHCTPIPLLSIFGPGVFCLLSITQQWPFFPHIQPSSLCLKCVCPSSWELHSANLTSFLMAILYFSLWIDSQVHFFHSFTSQYWVPGCQRYNVEPDSWRSKFLERSLGDPVAWVTHLSFIIVSVSPEARSLVTLPTEIFSVSPQKQRNTKPQSTTARPRKGVYIHYHPLSATRITANTNIFYAQGYMLHKLTY
jgi:hypothetical protein